jgi:translation initiation factor 2 alpha subunit (eIF-2alpha)
MVYYYKKKLPSVDDVVIAKVMNISEYGIEVSLVEYNGATGFINCSEVSRKKKVNFNKLLTIGKDILVHVLQVDDEKNMIDLSKRTIGDDDVKIFTDTHRSHIQLYNLFKQLYMKIYNQGIEKISQEELHKFLCLTLFELQTEFENEYLMEKLVDKETNSEIIDSIDFDSIEGLGREQFKSVLDDYIDKKINRTKPEITETIKLMTYSSTGVADIKYTLDFKSFENFDELKADFDIKINYMTSSAYSIVIAQKNFDLKGNKTINEINTFIKQEIKKRAVEKQIQNQIVL